MCKKDLFLKNKKNVLPGLILLLIEENTLNQTRKYIKYFRSYKAVILLQNLILNLKDPYTLQGQ